MFFLCYTLFVLYVVIIVFLWFIASPFWLLVTIIWVEKREAVLHSRSHIEKSLSTFSFFFIPSLKYLFWGWFLTWVDKNEKEFSASTSCIQIVLSAPTQSCTFSLEAKWIYSNTATKDKKKLTLFCLFDHFGRPYSLFSCRHMYSTLSLF